MELVIGPAGRIHCLYAEAIDLATLGRVHIRRASHVEPTGSGHWQVNFAPIAGPQLGSFSRRSIALEAEAAWLLAHWLLAGGR